MGALFASAIVAACAGVTLAGGATAQQVPEIANPNLNDIAIAVMTPTGPVIFWNPTICFNQVGLLVCGFYKAQEYGHVMLGHLQMGTYPPVAEMQADCFGAQHAAPAEVNAAIQAFQQQGPAGDASHGSGFQRAARLNDARMGNCHW